MGIKLTLLVSAPCLVLVAFSAHDAVIPSAASRAGSVPAASSSGQDKSADLVKAFAAHDITLDISNKLCVIPARVTIRDDLLEYVLCSPQGAVHETMFATDVSAQELNLALLALGVQPGKNVQYRRKEPPPTPEEFQKGAPAFDMTPPTGDGFYLYVGWKQGDETYFYRLEDLVRDVSTGQGMRRHKFVYLGSRMVKVRASPGTKGDSAAGGSKTDGVEEAFAADLEGNLINLAFFEQGNTVLTTALPECERQTIWLPNAWLMPERASRVAFVFARERLDVVPKDLAAKLPVVEPSTRAKDGR